MRIEPIINDDESFKTALDVIRKSFQTVAEEFKLTPQNAPTNPAFLTLESLRDQYRRGVSFYCMYDNSQTQIGFMALEKAEKGVYYLERLCVLPEWRERGYGRALADYAKNKVRLEGGTEISIGLINENSKLKRWYRGMEFEETGVKKYDHLPFTVCFMKCAL